VAGISQKRVHRASLCFSVQLIDVPKVSEIELDLINTGAEPSNGFRGLLDLGLIGGYEQSNPLRAQIPQAHNRCQPMRQ
jgi:hypothetical protein